MKKINKLISVLLIALMLVTSAPLSGFVGLKMPSFKATATDDNTKGELVLSTGNKITRAQWIHNLAVTFEMSVEDDAYPDNYFSDLESSDEYYHDILLAVNFGVVDIKAGGEFKPKEQLDRSFASHTLNFCLGFQPKKEGFSFSDYSDCEYPADAQIAVDRSWFALVGGKFSPKSFVTDAEVAKMINDAKEVLKSRAVNENYESSYKFDPSVIEIPDGTDVSVEDNTVKITSCPKTIKSSSRFAAYQGGIPKIYEAVSVYKSGDVTTVKVNPDFDGSSLFLSVDAQGVANASEFDIVPEKDTTMTVDEISEPSSSMKKAKATANLKRIYNFDKTLSLGDGLSVSCKITMENPKVEYSFSTSPAKAHVVFMGNATVSFDGSFDLTKATNLNSIPIGEIGIPGIGGLKFCVDLSLAGSVGISTSGNLRFGFNYSTASGFSIERNFVSSSYYLTAAANATAGISANFGIDTMIVKAGVYFKVGGTATINSKVFTDGKKPMECDSFSAFLYCSFGLDASVTVLGLKKGYKVNVNVWDANTSPVKVARHYEDGKEVASCARGGKIGYFTPWNSIYGSSGWSKGFGSTGYDRNGKPVAVFEYTVEEDEYKNEYAVITKYNGNATAIYVPETIDGYTVKKIANLVFEKKPVKNVHLPNTIIEMGNNTFYSCKNLYGVILPKSLVKLGSAAFGCCDSLTNIVIPKSLKEASGSFADSVNLYTAELESGMTKIPEGLFKNAYIKTIEIPDTITEIGSYCFQNCSELKTVKFSKFITRIGDSAFRNCQKLTGIVLPSSLESLCSFAFRNCTSLKTINIPKKLQDVGYYDGYLSLTAYPFTDCVNLKEVTFEDGITKIPDNILGNSYVETIEMPETVTKIGSCSFRSCSELKTVKFSKNITEIGYGAFRYCEELSDVELPQMISYIDADAFQKCKSLKSIKIPRTLTSVGSYNGRLDREAYPFGDCINLKKAEIEEGMKEIPEGLFEGCTGLENVTIPKSVTKIQTKAFANTSLREINIPNSVKEIGSFAFGNTKLENVVIPDSVESMWDSTFRGCSSLKTVKLPNIRQNIMAYMFNDCSKLERIELPATVTTIQDHAFKNCTSLKEVVFKGNKVETIGEYAFENCDSLTSLKLPSSVKTIKTGAFFDCDGFKTFTIPDSVTEFGSRTFFDNDSLEKVVIEAGIDTIYKSTFENCDELKDVKLPYSVKEIKDSAFKDCPKFVEMTIPRAVTYIDSSAFSYPLNMTIYGVSGTYAETFSKENGMKFVNKSVKATSVKLNKAKITLFKENKEKLSFTATPSNYTDAVVWKTSNPNVVSVDERGIIRGESVGTATIKLCVGNVTASCTVTVVQPVRNIYMNTKLELEAGEIKSLEVSISPSDANNKEVSYASSDPSIASVDSSGNVTAHKKGTALITVSAKDGSGVKNTCTVTVVNNCYTVTDIKGFESAHNYPVNSKDMWVYSKSGASSVSITFDKRTNIEDGFDCIKIYDVNNNEVGSYTGTQLSEKTITVKGNTVKVQLISDDAGTDWGFKVIDISFKTCQKHNFKDEIIAPTCTQKGYTLHTCTLCGFTKKDSVKDALGHSYKTSSVVSPASLSKDGKIEKECTSCGKKITTPIAKIASITLSKTSFVYSGKAQKPTVTVKDSNGKTVSSKNYTLSYSKGCTAVGTYSVKVTFKGNYSGTKTLSFKIVSSTPAQVKSLKASAKTSASVTLTWAKVSGASGYEVYKYSSSSKKYTKIGSTASNTFKVNELLSSTKYMFAVRAYSTSGGKNVYGKTSSLLTVTTSKQGKPAQVAKPKVTKITATTITLSWTKVGGADVKYYVFSYNAKTKKYTSLGSTTSNTFTAKKLKTGTKYSFAVQAYGTKSKKSGKVSSIVSTATAPVAPTITVTAGKKQATIKWNKVTGATNYTVYFATSKNGAYKSAGTTTKTSLTVSKLSSGKTYYFKVIANEKLGSATIKSAYSAVKSVKVK